MRIFWDAMPPTQPPQPPHRVELSTHLTCNLLDLYYSGMINFKKHPDDEDLDDAATGGLTNITTGTKFDKAHRPARPAACRHRASTALLRRQMTRINGDRFSGLRVAIEKLLVHGKAILHTDIVHLLRNVHENVRLGRPLLSANALVKELAATENHADLPVIWERVKAFNQKLYVPTDSGAPRGCFASKVCRSASCVPGRRARPGRRALPVRAGPSPAARLRGCVPRIFRAEPGHCARKIVHALYLLLL